MRCSTWSTPGADADVEGLVRTRGLERTVLAPEEATSERGLARALALGGWHFDRAAALRRVGVEGALASRVLAPFAVLPDPEQLPGPLRAAPVLSELGSRTVFSAGSLEGWIECPYRWFVSHELTPQLLEPEADPLWLGLARSPRARAPLPRPTRPGLDPARRRRRRMAAPVWRAARGRGDAAGARVAQPRPPRGARPREDPGRGVPRHGGRRRDRPAPGEGAARARFRGLRGGRARGGRGRGARSARAAGARGDLAARPDRPHRPHPDGHGAVVRDYKTGKRVSPAAKFATMGTLQIQLYMLVAERVLGLDANSDHRFEIVWRPGNAGSAAAVSERVFCTLPIGSARVLAAVAATRAAPVGRPARQGCGSSWSASVEPRPTPDPRTTRRRSVPSAQPVSCMTSSRPCRQRAPGGFSSRCSRLCLRPGPSLRTSTFRNGRRSSNSWLPP